MATSHDKAPKQTIKTQNECAYRERWCQDDGSNLAQPPIWSPTLWSLQHSWNFADPVWCPRTAAAPTFGATELRDLLPGTAANTEGEHDEELEAVLLSFPEEANLTLR
jgi:hypothetical protein